MRSRDEDEEKLHAKDMQLENFSAICIRPAALQFVCEETIS